MGSGRLELVCVGLPGHSLGDGRSVANYHVFLLLSSYPTFSPLALINGLQNGNETLKKGLSIIHWPEYNKNMDEHITVDEAPQKP